MKLVSLLENVNITEMHAPDDMDITDVCYDSRSAAPGCLFVAINGLGEDRHEYIADAAKNGVSCVLCSRAPEVEIPYVLTDDTLTGLAEASANFFGRPADKLKIVGVTGTNGKTTVTHLLKQMLEKLTGKPVGIIGTINNMIGEVSYETDSTTPEAYELHKLFAAMTAAGCEYAVMEVSSHSLAMKRVEGITFEAAVFTNITQDHLDFHGSMEVYAKAKAQLLTQSKQAAVNADDEILAELMKAAECPILTFSAKSDIWDLVARQIRLHADSVDFCALEIGQLERTELAIPGMFSVYNALATLAALQLLGFELPETAKLLPLCHGVRGRAEVVPVERDFTVIIDYAHTPDALENIIKTLKSCAKGRVVTLFGCGGDRDRTKRPIMGETVGKLSDFAIVTTDNPRTEAPGDIINDITGGMADIKTPHTVIENRRDAIFWAIKNAKSGDTILLAGKGHETYQTIGHENFPFDEREIVAEALSEI